MNKRTRDDTAMPRSFLGVHRPNHVPTRDKMLTLSFRVFTFTRSSELARQDKPICSRSGPHQLRSETQKSVSYVLCVQQARGM